MADGSLPARVIHRTWGTGTLLRIEGTDWLVRLDRSGQTFRFPAEKRQDFSILTEQLSSRHRSPNSSPQILSRNNVVAPTTSVVSANKPEHDGVGRLLAEIKQPASHGSKYFTARQANHQPFARAYGLKHSPSQTLSRWHKRCAIESLANGLPPAIDIGRQLAVDFDVIGRMIATLLSDISTEGGGALVVKGGYGQGKTLALRCLEDIALESGYLVARTEIDASENRLNKPHQIYRDLMRHIRVPGFDEPGTQSLVRAAMPAIASQCNSLWHDARFAWLQAQLACRPLAWLFSDPKLASKEDLVGLLSANPDIPISRARRRHAVPPNPRYWPAFNAGTQGDFGSFLLSGIGRLARLMGFKGFVIVMDEMEKWKDLNWHEQSRAGNLLGGLIWAATERGDRRRRDCYPGGLTHSTRCNGYPFSTESPCYVGLAIAMTPRSEDDDPEQIWSQYGPLLDVDLPQLTVEKLRQYCRRVSPLFSEAYGTPSPTDDALKDITHDAVNLWRAYGEMTNRSAVQSAVAAFNNWRDRTDFEST